MQAQFRRPIVERYPPRMKYKWTLLDAGRLKLDAGSLFGLIPRVVWERDVPIDDKHRITVAHNCLLLEPIGDGPTVVIEAGTGDKLGAKMRKIFDLGPKTVESALAGAGKDPSDIDAVIVTHLHFDHAGGLTRRARDGEDPDWIAPEGESSGDDPHIKLTFPNAEVITQAREWADAEANNSVMTRTYYRDHLEPIKGRVRLIDSPVPFPAHPNRDDLPPTSVDERMTEVLPGIEVFNVPGHTWGQQGVRFHDEGGNPIVFTPDLIPTRWHVGAAYSLAYDVEPYTSMVTKRWFLTEAERAGWTLVLDHDPDEPVVRAVPDGRGWWKLDPVVG